MLRRPFRSGLNPRVLEAGRGKTQHARPDPGLFGICSSSGGPFSCQIGQRYGGSVARPPRVLVAGGAYHVTARGNRRQPIYLDTGDRRGWLDLLGEEARLHGVEVIAYCEMGNHFHLLVVTPRANLPRFMRGLNGRHGQSFNRRHDCDGHVFQGRYDARLVQTDNRLLAVVRYIVQNPVVAGLCEHPRQWPWSSHRATLGLEPAHLLTLDRLYGQLGATIGQARRAYASLTEGDWPDGLGPHPLVEGEDAYIERMLAAVEPSSEHPRAMVQPVPPSLSSVLESGGDRSAIERAVLHGYSLRAVADHLGVHASTVSRRLRSSS